MALLVLSVIPHAIYAREDDDDEREGEHEKEVDDNDKEDRERETMMPKEELFKRGLKIRSINSGHGKGTMMGGQLVDAMHFDRNALRMAKDNILKQRCLNEDGETDRCMEHFGMFKWHLSEVAHRIKTLIKKIGERVGEEEDDYLRSMMGKVEEAEAVLKSEDLTREQLIEASKTLRAIMVELNEKYGELKKEVQKMTPEGMAEKFEHMTQRIDRIIRVLKAIAEKDERQELKDFINKRIERIQAVQSEITELLAQENYEAAKEKMKSLHNHLKETAQGIQKYRKNNRNDMKENALNVQAIRE